jgi:transcriptional regulator with XRE-family HTH domain
MTPQQLLDWRTDKGLTQEVLASMLGLDRGTINRYENGKRKIPPTLELALKGLELKRDA